MFKMQDLVQFCQNTLVEYLTNGDKGWEETVEKITKKINETATELAIKEAATSYETYC